MSVCVVCLCTPPTPWEGQLCNNSHYCLAINPTPYPNAASIPLLIVALE